MPVRVFLTQELAETSVVASMLQAYGIPALSRHAEIYPIREAMYVVEVPDSEYEAAKALIEASRGPEASA